MGAGELLVTSMDADGTKNGFDIAMLNAITDTVCIPVIASGGAGKQEDFTAVFSESKVTGALAASIFHFNEMTVPELKTYLKQQTIPIR
jgi:cyclase